MTAPGMVLPAAKDVRDMLSGLLGKDVTVAPGGPVTPTADAPVAVAVYVDPHMAVNAICVMDLGASAYTGAALALLPPGGAQDAVEEDGELTGIECLVAMRSSGSTVPFGFVTSEGSPEMREKAANAGALFLIAKPFTEDTFKEHLDGVIA